MFAVTRKMAPCNHIANKGLSLVELMVSIVLGLILTAGIIGVYLESKRNYSAEEEMARIQENGRFSLNMLKRELTLAGFYGGNLEMDDLTAAAVTTDCAAGVNWALDTAGDALELISDYSSSFLTVNGTSFNCLTGSEIEGGTDIFSIKRTAGDFTLKNGAYNDGLGAADTSQWYLKLVTYGQDKEWVYIGSAGAFDAADVGAGTEVDYWEFFTKIFYIRNFSTTAGDGIPTLCVERLMGDAMATECLVEGVEDMQIEFGVDTDGDGVPNQFKTSPTATEISSAVTARVYLLLRSIGPVVGHTDTKTYNLGQKNVVAKNDGFIRRVFSTTVQLRNSVLPEV